MVVGSGAITVTQKNALKDQGAPTMTDAIDRHSWTEIKHRYQRDHMSALKPVIITDAFEQWPARTKWTPEFFRRRYFDTPIVVDGKPLKLGELVDLVAASTPTSPAPYLKNHKVETLPAELLDDISPSPRCIAPNWLDSRLFASRNSLKATEFYFGGAGAKFPFLHYDVWHLHAFLMQVYGVKEYVAFAPSETRYMYPLPGAQENVSAVNSIDEPDVARFPLFQKARGYRFKLYPGETLFIPAGWWHTARILSTSITISVNGANKANWTAFTRDVVREQASRSKLRSAVTWAYLSTFDFAMRLLEVLA